MDRPLAPVFFNGPGRLSGRSASFGTVGPLARLTLIPSPAALGNESRVYYRRRARRS